MAYATKTAVETGGGFRHQFRAEIGSFAPVEVAPDAFSGMEVRRIGGELLDVQPAVLSPEDLCAS